MTATTVTAAAAAIRDKLSEIPAEFRFAISFAERVALELGMDANPANTIRVMKSLEEQGIEPEMQEYPKWVGEGSAAKIVNSAIEERDYLDLLAADAAAAEEGALQQEAERRSVSVETLRDETGSKEGPKEGDPPKIEGQQT